MPDRLAGVIVRLCHRRFWCAVNVRRRHLFTLAYAIGPMVVQLVQADLLPCGERFDFPCASSAAQILDSSLRECRWLALHESSYLRPRRWGGAEDEVKSAHVAEDGEISLGANDCPTAASPTSTRNSRRDINEGNASYQLSSNMMDNSDVRSLHWNRCDLRCHCAHRSPQRRPPNR